MSVNEHEMRIINDAFDMSRAEAIEQLEKAYKECISLGQTCGKDSVFWKRAEAIKVAIKALEQEPKRGHWIKSNPLMLSECSECGNKAFGYHGFDEVLTDFCPNCGCRMVEPQESEE